MTPRQDSERPTIGLVLGAGGVVGAAFHAGTLGALAAAGFDARQAAVIVGTSAGSGMAATLRAGFPPADLVARMLGGTMSAEGRAVVERAGPVPEMPFRPQRPIGLPRPVSAAVARKALRRPTLLLTGLPPGGNATAPIGDRLRRLYEGDRWSDDPLWICAVRTSDGARVVFGRDDVTVPVPTAVEASSAVPGFFEPVRHGGETYVDGGIHSATNADVLEGLGLDLVVVLSPMSGTRDALRPPRFDGRLLHARRLAAEVAGLRNSGSEVLTFQPTAAQVRAAGANAMDPSPRREVAGLAYEAARQRLDDPRLAARVTVLLGR